MESAIWGFIGTIIGALASIGTAWISARNTSLLQGEKALAERKERSNAFQRQTLLELQDSMHDALRLVYKAFHEDLLSSRSGTKWGSTILSDELNESSRAANQKVAILIERVSNDSLRKEVKKFMAIATKALLASSETEARTILEGSYAYSNSVFELIGETLRQHY
ncbi:MAG: hypothetical protein ABII81_05545 [Pseudomonadota bacterium]